MKGLSPIPEKGSQRTRERVMKKNQNNYEEAIKRFDLLVPQLREVLKSRQKDLGGFTVVVNGLHGVNYTGIPANTLHEDWLKTSSFVYSSELKAKRIDEPSRLLSLTSTILDLAEVETFDPSRELMNIHDKGFVELSKDSDPSKFSLIEVKKIISEIFSC